MEYQFRYLPHVVHFNSLRKPDVTIEFSLSEQATLLCEHGADAVRVAFLPAFLRAFASNWDIDCEKVGNAAGAEATTIYELSRRVSNPSGGAASLEVEL